MAARQAKTLIKINSVRAVINVERALNKILRGWRERDVSVLVASRTTGRQCGPVRDVGSELGLPRLLPIELRMVARSDLSPAASELHDILERVARERVTGAESTSGAAS